MSKTKNVSKVNKDFCSSGYEQEEIDYFDEGREKEDLEV